MTPAHINIETNDVDRSIDNSSNNNNSIGTEQA